MMYIRFLLSLRNVEDPLDERGIDASHEAVRFRWHRFGPMFASKLRKRRIEGRKSSGWRWHLDEMIVKIIGERHYLWRAVDHEGEILEGFVMETRDKKAALKFLRKAMRKHGRPEVMVTGRIRSYGCVQMEVHAGHRQKTGPWLNNRAESSHQPFRPRGGAMLRFRRMRVCRYSPPSVPRSATVSTRSAALPADGISSSTAPPLLLNGVVFARHKRKPFCRWSDWFALRWRHPSWRSSGACSGCS